MSTPGNDVSGRTCEEAGLRKGDPISADSSVGTDSDPWTRRTFSAAENGSGRLDAVSTLLFSSYSSFRPFCLLSFISYGQNGNADRSLSAV